MKIRTQENSQEICTGGESKLRISTGNSVVFVEFEEGDRLLTVRLRLTPNEAKEMAKALTKFSNAAEKEEA